MVQWKLLMTWSFIKPYFTKHDNDKSRIQITPWTHKGHPIPLFSRECHFLIFWRIIIVSEGGSTAVALICALQCYMEYDISKAYNILSCICILVLFTCICITVSLQYKTHLSGQLNCRSLRCSWSIACRRCSNYIFILDLTPGFKGLGKDNFKTRWESFKFWDLVQLILETLRYTLGCYHLSMH